MDLITFTVANCTRTGLCQPSTDPNWSRLTVASPKQSLPVKLLPQNQKCTFQPSQHLLSITRIQPSSPHTLFAYRNARPSPTALAPRQSALSTSVPRVTPPSINTWCLSNKSGRNCRISYNNVIGAGELYSLAELSCAHSPVIITLTSQALGRRDWTGRCRQPCTLLELAPRPENVVSHIATQYR